MEGRRTRRGRKARYRLSALGVWNVVWVGGLNRGVSEQFGVSLLCWRMAEVHLSDAVEPERRRADFHHEEHEGHEGWTWSRRKDWAWPVWNVVLVGAGAKEFSERFGVSLLC